MKKKTINDMYVGQSASKSKKVEQIDVDMFTDISGDMNPVHVNPVEAEKTRFNGVIAHGMITAGHISAVIGMYLPGPGAIYLGQEIRFTAPVIIGDVITTTVTVQSLLYEKNIVKLETVCKNQNDVVVATGVATIMPSKEA